MSISDRIFKNMKREKVRLNGHDIIVLSPKKTLGYDEGMAKMKEIVVNLKKG